MLDVVDGHHDAHLVVLVVGQVGRVRQQPPLSRRGGVGNGRVHQVADNEVGVVRVVEAPVLRGAELGHGHGLARCVKRELLLVQLGPGVVGQGYPDIDLAGVLAHFP